MNENYFLIGIKGSGMSALACILYDLGFNVKGSDVDKYFFTEKELTKRNIAIKEFNEVNIVKGYTYIAGNAFDDNQEEIKKAKSEGYHVIRYHDFLKQFMSSYKSIAITGSHGKTTTTGIMAHVLSHIKNTSYLIGDGTGVGANKSDYFVFEACEYRRHFLSYYPNYSIITSIDFDHPDYFKDLNDVKDAFSNFIKQTKDKVIMCGDDELIRGMSRENAIFYGLDKTNDLYATNIIKDEKGTYFEAMYQNKKLGMFFVPLFGNHQIQNTLAVILQCLLEALPMDEVREALKTFEGVKRRFQEEIVGTNVVVDDYAHHPKEIKATIESAKLKYPNKKCIAIFQPHTFTRTEVLLNEFADSFNHADDVYLCDIFSSAREQERVVTIEALIKKTKRAKKITIDEMNQLNDENSVLLFMGAGDIQKYIKAYKKTV